MSSTTAPPERFDLKRRIRQLYDGTGRVSVVFRWTLLAVDLLTIALFVEMTFFTEQAWAAVVEFTLGLALLFDYMARCYASERRWLFVVKPLSIADAIVIASMLAGPFAENLGFFRVLRALRLVRSYQVLGLLRRRYRWVRQQEEMLLAITNLLVFLFFTTAVVFVTQNNINPQIEDYLDALYFSVATLTTTGFGDITLVGDVGKLLSVAIMIVGITLFLRVVQTVFRPNKVRHTCEQCGLERHEPDAVHCKHCGETLRIATEGMN